MSGSSAVTDRRAGALVFVNLSQPLFSTYLILVKPLFSKIGIVG